jgi:hypothetical protein
VIMKATRRRHGMVFLIFVATLLVWGVWSAPARAAEGLVVYPTRIELDARRGETLDTTIKVYNNSETTLTLTFKAWNFARDNRNRVYALEERDYRRFGGMAHWVELPVKAMKLKPGDRRSLKLKIAVPKRIRRRSYYAYFKIKVLRADRPKKGIITQLKLNHLLLLRVETKNTDRLAILRGLSEKRLVVARWNFGPKVDFQAVFRNKSNIHDGLTGRFLIRDYQGRLVKRLDQPVQTILPNSHNRVASTWVDPPLFGRFSLTYEGVILGKKRMVLRNYFWVVSPAAAVAGLVGLVLLIGVSAYLKRNFRFVKREDGSPRSPGTTR